jgi:hypothetical protein
MQMRIPTFGIVALLTLVGCGGMAAGPTKAQYTARADAICAFENEKLHRAAAFEHAPVAAFSSVPRLIREAVAIRAVANAKLESLAKPAGEGATIEKWLTARTVQATLRRDVAEAPAREFPTAAKDVKEALDRASALERDLSQSYGFRICSATE